MNPEEALTPPNLKRENKAWRIRQIRVDPGVSSVLPDRMWGNVLKSYDLISESSKKPKLTVEDSKNKEGTNRNDFDSIKDCLGLLSLEFHLLWALIDEAIIGDLVVSAKSKRVGNGCATE